MPRKSITELTAQAIASFPDNVGRVHHSRPAPHHVRGLPEGHCSGVWCLPEDCAANSQSGTDTRCHLPTPRQPAATSTN